MTDNRKTHMTAENLASTEKRENGIRRRVRHGFSLVETMISFLILVLIGAAFMTLFVNIAATSTRANTTAYTVMDAAKAVDRVSLVLREARRFEFMDNGTTGPAAYQTPTSLGNNSNYLCVPSASTTESEKIVTGIHIVNPATLPGIRLDVPSGTGFAATSMNGSNALVDYRMDGDFLDIYRSDRNGRPAPKTGTCLWMRGTLNGAPVKTDSLAAAGIDGKPLVDDIAAWSGAVQFIQGQTNEVRIKIVTGTEYNVGKKVTSDSSKGTVTSLAAVNVFLRNQDLSVLQEKSTHGKVQYTKD